MKPDPLPAPVHDAVDADRPRTTDHAGGDVTPGGSTGDLSGLTDLLAAAGFVAADAEVDPLPGLVVGGVRIGRLLGAGGMGRVYEGMQEQPRRPVALKVMRPGLASAGAQERFRREAEILGRLDHPGIARIHAAGTSTIGRATLHWFVMELVPDARPLPAHAAAAALGIDARLDLFTEVCDAVAHGHERGVVHRDLKPGNILVDGAGRPRVIDFGVARGPAGSTVADGLTTTGAWIGTPRYMSPEQCAGQAAVVDARSDVYALGVILHELLTGRLPHALDGVGVIEAADLIRHRPPTSARRLVAAVPPAVDRVIDRCLRKAPAARYADAGALAAALRGARAGVQGRVRRRRLALVALVALGAAAVVAVGAWNRPAGAAAPLRLTLDLRAPPGATVVRSENARIYEEPASPVCYWAPVRQREWAEVVYRFDVPFSFAEVRLAGVGVDAWNLHADVPFDPAAAARLECSFDGERWTEIASHTPERGVRPPPESLTAPPGARSLWLRARLYETNSWNSNRVHRAQFLRSQPALGQLPVLEFRRRGG